MGIEYTNPIISTPFAARMLVDQVEEGFALTPKFDGDELIPYITADAYTGEGLMLGYMEGETLQRMIVTGEVHYLNGVPRSQGFFWVAANQRLAWHLRISDRAQQLVFFGQQMSDTALRTCLDACLVEACLASADSNTWVEL